VYPAYQTTSQASKVTLPSTNVVKVESISFYDAAYPLGSVLPPGFICPGSVVYVRATASDPFGYADVSGGALTITDPGGTVRLNSAAMTALSSSSGPYRNYEYPYLINAAGPTGNWTAKVVANEGTEGTVSDFAQVTLPVTSPSLTLVMWANGQPAITVPPGDVVTYSLLLTNTGLGYATNVLLSNFLGGYVSWQLDSLALTDASCGLALGTASYSNDGGTSWTYTPVSGAGGAPAGYDNFVTNWKLPLPGNMTPYGPSCTVTFQAMVR